MTDNNYGESRELREFVIVTTETLRTQKEVIKELLETAHTLHSELSAQERQLIQMRSEVGSLTRWREKQEGFQSKIILLFCGVFITSLFSLIATFSQQSN